VFDLPAEQPAHRLQAGVRMRGDVHTARRGDVIRTVVVREAPGSDQRPGPLRQRPPYAHRTRAAQGHLPRRQHIDQGRSGLPPVVDQGSAPQLRGFGFDIAHRDHPSTYYSCYINHYATRAG
jgi:hypothetical protein